MDKIRTYVFTGFLESGKTTFLKDTLNDEDFYENEKTLLIVLEEGEVEYEPDTLLEHNVFMETIDYDDISVQLLVELTNKYEPTQVMIEFNGTRNLDEFIDQIMPRSWEIVQVLTTLDATNFNMYSQNMASFLYQQTFLSDLIIVNRCSDGKKVYKIRPQLKTINTKAQLIFEDLNNKIIDPKSIPLPYDIRSNYIEVNDFDFGIFCNDALEQPNRYKNKKIKIKGKIIGLDKYTKDGFIMARQAMVCCAEDLQLIGLVCVNENAESLHANDWYEMIGTMDIEYEESTDAYVPILKVDEMTKCEPLDNEYVSFD